MRIREKEEIRQRQSVLVDLACDGIFHDQQLWQRQHRKRKQFYLSWWVHLHGEQGRNGKLPLGRSCWRRFAALWLAPEDYGKNNDYDEQKFMMILTTTWTEQSFCLSSREVELSSRERIHMFRGRDITVARPDDRYDHDDDDYPVPLKFPEVLFAKILLIVWIPMKGFLSALHQPDIQQHL